MAARRAEKAGAKDAATKRAAFVNFSKNMEGGTHPAARNDEEDDEEDAEEKGEEEEKEEEEEEEAS